MAPLAFHDDDDSDHDHDVDGDVGDDYEDDDDDDTNVKAKTILRYMGDIFGIVLTWTIQRHQALTDETSKMQL